LTGFGLNQKLVGNNITNFVNGVGYLLSYESNDTKNFTGTFNTGDVTFDNLSVTPAEGNGWHLLGNPFQSALYWTNAAETWAPTAIETGAKILDGRTYIDVTSDGTYQYIPANQGFFVHATNTTNSITIPAAERVHNSTSLYKSDPVNNLELVASDGNLNSIKTWIQIMDDATAGFDMQYDVHFLGGMYQAPHLYSIVSGIERVSTNRVAPVEESTIIQLGFKSFHNTEYTISANFVSSFSDDLDIILEDTQENIQINLKETPTYTFMATADELTEHFKIHLLKSTGIHEANQIEGLTIYSQANTLYLNSDKAANALVEMYNVTGQKVFAKKVTLDGLTQINPQLTTGWYVVKVSTTDGMATEKVFIK